MIKPRCFRFIRPGLKAFILLAAVFLSSCVLLDGGTSFRYLSHRVQDDSLIIQSEFGEVRFNALPGESIEVHYLQTGISQLPSFAKSESLLALKPEVEVRESTTRS